MPKKIIAFISLTSVIISSFLCLSRFAWREASASIESLPGLQRRVTVVRDRYGVPHINAASDHDAYFMMGYLQAQDRFFQMDVLRRQGYGTLTELLGEGPNDQILNSDILIRLLGVGRSAERSLGAYAPDAAALVKAYADGVNAWLDSNFLPPEYTALEITKVPRWTPLDSITIIKLIQFTLSFDLNDLDRTLALLSYQAAGQSYGFDGTKLFFEDIFTFAPFDKVVTIPNPPGVTSSNSHEIQPSSLQNQIIESARRAQQMISPATVEAAREFIGKYNNNPLSNRTKFGTGSNWWVIAGSKTDTGNAMLANDPHLSLGSPPMFYEIHLVVDSDSSPMNVYGVSYVGTPGVILGQNDRISWGATTSSLDVTDVFIESVVIENGSPVATRYKDKVEPLVILPEEFKVNQVPNGVADDLVIVSPGIRPSGASVPSNSLIVPRRNNGPLLPFGPSDSLSIQFAGASATRDLEGIFALARARNLGDFKRGLHFLEVGSLNWAYADVDGNIATYVNGKVPLREDLQAEIIDGLPPFLLRDGTGAFKNEWVLKRESGAGGEYESLPFEELPHIVNPAQGFLVNANNDPIGITFDNNPINQTRSAGIYYISSGFNPGFRAAKITGLLEHKLGEGRGPNKISFEEMKRIQANIQMFDAEVFTPYILHAFAVARSPAAPAPLRVLANDPAVQEAVERLSTWDFSTPTGISEGYDNIGKNNFLQRSSKNEVSNSVAATIFTVWRSQILANTIIATLQRVGLGDIRPGSDRILVDLRFLLDNLSTDHGVGASGLDFFDIQGIDAPPQIRRDIIILRSLKDALELLASGEFADAFNRSRNQSDYRWGKLHRITFGHIFGGLAPQFSIPTAGNFEHLSPLLPGLATDGSWETIDNASFDALAASSQSYTYNGGAARRYVGELRHDGIKSVQVIPGGESGVVGNRFYADQLSLWLINDYHPVLTRPREINSHRYSEIIYSPSN